MHVDGGGVGGGGGGGEERENEKFSSILINTVWGGNFNHCGKRIRAVAITKVEK